MTAAFRARLEPELTAQDLDTRAGKALEICLASIAEDNEDRATRAFARMVQRWAERDALLPAPKWILRQRYDLVAEVLSEVPEEWAGLMEAVWTQFYITLVRLGGMSADAASDYAYGRVANMRALEAGQ